MRVPRGLDEVVFTERVSHSHSHLLSMCAVSPNLSTCFYRLILPSLYPFYDLRLKLRAGPRGEQNYLTYAILFNQPTYLSSFCFHKQRPYSY